MTDTYEGWTFKHDSVSGCHAYTRNDGVFHAFSSRPLRCWEIRDMRNMKILFGLYDDMHEVIEIVGYIDRGVWDGQDRQTLYLIQSTLRERDWVLEEEPAREAPPGSIIRMGSDAPERYTNRRTGGRVWKFEDGSWGWLSISGMSCYITGRAAETIEEAKRLAGG
jgi:hypothetical protein